MNTSLGRKASTQLCKATQDSVQTMGWSESDIQFMTRALEVAEISRGRIAKSTGWLCTGQRRPNHR